MITEIQMCENDVFVLPVNILTGVACQLLGPHDTLPCVLIFHYPSEYCHSTIHYIAVWCLTELLPQSTYSNFTDLILHFFSPCNRGGMQKLLAMPLDYTSKLLALSLRLLFICYGVSVHIVMAIHSLWCLGCKT